MKIFSLSQGERPLLAAAGFMAAVVGWSAAAQAAILHLPNDSAIFVNSATVKKTLFLSVADVQFKLPITIRADAETGLSVLCTTHDCRPVYWGDDQEMLVTDTAVYVSVEAVAEALGCRAKSKRKRDVYLTCPEGWPTQKVGAQTGERAPGFRLKAAGTGHVNVEETPLSSPRERGENGDSVVALNDLLSRGPVVVAFVRSGQWDPLSRLLLEALESKLDSLRGAGCEVVAVHGYEPKVGTKWAAELKLHFAQLADNASAVMRGYEVFDQGRLPHCAVFLLDREGMIRYRQVYENDVTLPDMEPIMKEVERMKDEARMARSYTACCVSLVG
jgi:peroxiredoxin